MNAMLPAPAGIPCSVAGRVRPIIECAVVQAALWHPDTWAPILREILTMRDLRDYLNRMTWRAYLMTDGDFVRVGRSLEEELPRPAWERWIDRYCGGFETFVNDVPPVEELFDALRADDDAELVALYSRLWPWG